MKHTHKLPLDTPEYMTAKEATKNARNVSVSYDLESIVFNGNNIRIAELAIYDLLLLLVEHFRNLYWI